MLFMEDDFPAMMERGLMKCDVIDQNRQRDKQQQQQQQQQLQPQQQHQNPVAATADIFSTTTIDSTSSSSLASVVPPRSFHSQHNNNSQNLLLFEMESSVSEPKRMQKHQALDDETVEEQPDTLCSICRDKATGKHYGANSCDGCKGFFRRSIRKTARYICRYNKDCLINKEKRNQCRYCRLSKCLHAGMKKQAVQTERDKISQYKFFKQDDCTDCSISINYALEVERSTLQLHQPTPQNVYADVFTKEMLAEAMEFQVKVLITWAKQIACFSCAEIQDQVRVLKSQIAELLILGAVQRTLVANKSDILILANNCVIHRNNCDPDISEVAQVILDNVMFPLQHIALDSEEYAALKVIILLEPAIKKLSQQCAGVFRHHRNCLQRELMNYMNEKQYGADGRFGQMLLVLPNLRAVSRVMVARIRLTDRRGHVMLDRLVKDVLCSEPIDMDMDPNLSACNETGSDNVQTPLIDGQVNSVTNDNSLQFKQNGAKSINDNNGISSGSQLQSYNGESQHQFFAQQHSEHYLNELACLNANAVVSCTKTESIQASELEPQCDVFGPSSAIFRFPRPSRSPHNNQLPPQQVTSADNPSHQLVLDMYPPLREVIQMCQSSAITSSSSSSVIPLDVSSMFPCNANSPLNEFNPLTSMYC